MAHKPVNRIVLIMVDDDEDDCLMVEAALYEALLKCDFHCVQDGIAMMEYLNRSGQFHEPGAAPRPDIILLDLNLPRMNGREVLQQLKSDPEFRSIPVIVLTTSTEEEDIVFCYNAGANTYIVKKPSFEGLVWAIKIIKDFWLETATLPTNRGYPDQRKDPSKQTG
jgi:CheY-like chemotaxis protein